MRLLILRREVILVSFLLLLISNNLKAQQTTAQHTNDIISYGTVYSNIALDTIHSFRSPDKKCAFISEGIKIGSTVLISEILKHFINEERPDGSDNKSFPSEHTAIAASTAGWSIGFGLSLAIGTGVERVTANRHHWYDVLAGGAIGYGVNLTVAKAMDCKEN